jgi:hypothetical protein
MQIFRNKQLIGKYLKSHCLLVRFAFGIFFPKFRIAVSWGETLRAAHGISHTESYSCEKMALDKRGCVPGRWPWTAAVVPALLGCFTSFSMTPSTDVYGALEASLFFRSS